MNLYFTGHQEKYAVEQTMLTLFPQERPVYPDPAVTPPGGDNALELQFTRRPSWCTARAVLRREGKVYSRMCRVRTAALPADDPVVATRLTRRTLQRAFYLAAIDCLGKEPPWGMLSGVRPVKLPTRAMEEGGTPRQAEAMLKHYHVSPVRRQLAMDCAQASLAVKRSLQPEEISLYVGIPFCPTRCAYCSFVSQSVERSFSLVEPYVKALIAEIRSGGDMVRSNRLRPRAFYMGGGTPGILTPDQMDAILTALEESFDLSACPELTVEAGRPDTITAEKLAVLKSHGVTRVCVNPQTMEDHVLAAIGRRHASADTVRAMELVRTYRFPHVNMDLIAGLPADTPEGFRRSLDKCLELGADDITIHTLALKKGSRILMEGLSIPDGAAVQAMLDYAAPTLRAAGFVPYYLYRQKYMSGSFENVGWSRPGGECWYNVDIMSELCSILSFGAGGSTKMVEPGTNHIERVFNLKYPKEYTERPEKIQQNQAAFAEFYQKYVPET